MADGSSRTARLDAHARLVADKLIEQLKAGTAPWQRPWEPGQPPVMPHNPTTGKPYRGGNAMWLLAQGRSDPRWLTFKQAQAEGANVRKGEHGTHLEYFIREDQKLLKDSQGKPILDSHGNKQTITEQYDRPKVVGFTVFNAEQIDGLKPLAPKEPAPEWERHARAEAILQASGARIQHVNGNEAYYRPSSDSITLPERGQFKSADAYYATALHELSHWTGHESRLDRGKGAAFGTESYAKEELRAEIGSMMIGDRIGVGHSPDADGNGQHAAYVKSWVKALQDDPREIFRAARDAEKIQDYVMGFDHEHEAKLDPQQQSSEPTAEEAERWTRDEWKIDPALHRSPEPGQEAGQLWQEAHAEAAEPGHQRDPAQQAAPSAEIDYDDGPEMG